MSFDRSGVLPFFAAGSSALIFRIAPVTPSVTMADNVSCHDNSVGSDFILSVFMLFKSADTGEDVASGRMP